MARGVFLLYRSAKLIKHKRIKAIIISFIAMILALTIGLIIMCESKLSDFMPEYIRTQSQLLSSDAITNAVNITLSDLNISYEDVVKITYSDTGVVRSIQTNTAELNKIKISVVNSAENELRKVHDCAVDIPLGAFTDISILSNTGPNININMSIEGSFNAKFVSTFEQAGLNQTIHHIKLLLTTNLITTSLDYKGSIAFEEDYEIAQTVIVGNIPDSYGSLYKTQ